MKNATIWESASRPLFVRSVWLETAKTARAPQRHFILDYETQRTQQQHYAPHSYNGLLRKRRKESLQQLVSCELYEVEQSRASAQSPESIDDLLRIASSKFQLQPLNMAAQTLKQKPKHNGPKRLTKRNLDQLEPNASAVCTRSRQLLPAVPSGMEQVPAVSKHLAERVLNWLDLAVKVACPECTEPTLQSEVSPSAQRCATAKLAEGAMGRTRHRPMPPHHSETPACQMDAMKCVSIVFERQQPSPKPFKVDGTVRPRRLNALERLHKSADVRRIESVVQRPTDTPAAAESARRGSVACKKSNACLCVQDTAKKQLHIFMPSLPAKRAQLETSLLAMSAEFASTIDSASALSANANDC